MRIVFRKLDAKSPGLHPHGGVTLRIEARRAAKNLSGNLIFLERDAGVIKRVFSQIAEEFAQGFRAVEAMTINKFIYLLEGLIPAYREGVRDSHLTD